MIEVLDKSNFKDFLYILKQRGRVNEAYYQWKYMDNLGLNDPRGLICYKKGKPVGCIGNVPKRLNGSNLKSTWFADWFVLEEFRKEGIGVQLLSELSHLYDHGYGIPGPSKARKIAEQVGYTPNTTIFYDQIISFNKFKFGYNRFGGSVIKKCARGIRELISKEMFFGESYFQPQVYTDLKLIERNLNSEMLSSCFYNDDSFIRWFFNMPLPHGSHWLLLKNKTNEVCLGLQEMDIWKLKRFKVFLGNINSFSQYIRKDLQIDYCLVPQLQGFTQGNNKMNPIFIVNKGLDLVSINGLDRENIWLSQKMY